jgi:hypothetical protein
MEGLLHEIECWRMRYKALEEKMAEGQRNTRGDDKIVS